MKNLSLYMMLVLKDWLYFHERGILLEDGTHEKVSDLWGELSPEHKLVARKMSEMIYNPGTPVV